MKPSVLIWFLLMAFSFAGCHRPSPVEETAYVPSRHLAAIDTLMQSQPDSALTLLLDSTMDDPYYQLLVSEALYKNDYTQTNRAKLLEAMAYFDSIGEPFLAARCHYMNGVGYYEMDSVVPACAEYLKALETMEEHYEEKEFVGYKAKIMALINTHLCSLFSNQYLDEPAIYFGKHALTYYRHYDDEPWHTAWVLCRIGARYETIEQYDSADYYFNKALEILPDTNNMTYRDLIASKAFLSYNQNKETDKALKDLYCILDRSESCAEYLSRCMIIGEFYYQKKMWDSAWIYFDTVFNSIQNTDVKIVSAQRLRDICLKTGDALLLNNYTLYLSQQAKTSAFQVSVNSQLTELYHLFVKNKNTNNRQEKLLKKGNIIIASLFFTALITAIFLFSNTKKLAKERHQKIAIENNLETEKRAHQMQQLALSGRLRRSNEKLKKVSQQLENYVASKNVISENKPLVLDYNAFKQEPVCLEILEEVKDKNFKPKIDYLIYKKCALTKEQVEARMNAADQHLGCFTVRIRKLYPELTKEDACYCCLYLLGLNEADIAALMQRAYSTVCERQRKIKRILKTQEDLFVALRGIV